MSAAKLEPIFLHTSWRTGGTALAFAFREQPRCALFYEPINIALQDPEKAFLASPGKWDSKHPSNAPYFNEFKAFLTQDGTIRNFPNLDLFTFESPKKEWLVELARYLHMLIDYAQGEGKVPVFKFTNLEGHLDFLRKEFPSSTNIAVSRGRSEQLLSWLSQAANGNYEFFKAGSKMIGRESNNPFIGKRKMDQLSSSDIATVIDDFNTYRDLLDSFHKKMDFVLNISPEAAFTPEKLLKFVEKKHLPQLSLWKKAIKYLASSRPTIATEDNRLQIAYIRTIFKDREIGLKNIEIGGKNREIARLQAQYQMIIGSSSWKITAPWRRLGALLKKSKN